jgi:hypothetical protein
MNAFRKTMTFEERQLSTSAFEHESVTMNYQEMPAELNELAMFIMQLQPDLKVEALKKLYELSPEIKQKSPLEVGQYLEGLNLRSKIEQYLTEIYTSVYSGTLSKGRRGIHQGFSGEEDYKEDDSDAQGYLGSSENTKSKKKNSGDQKGSQGDVKSAAKKKSYYLKEMSPSLAWQQVGSSKVWTTYKDALPIAVETEILPSADIYCNLDQNYNQCSRFTSTPRSCGKCQSAKDNGDKKGHTPPCFLGTCSMCQSKGYNRWGHTGRVCLHFF